MSSLPKKLSLHLNYVDLETAPLYSEPILALHQMPSQSWDNTGSTGSIITRYRLKSYATRKIILSLIARFRLTKTLKNPLAHFNNQY
jgi:hypothetical protein